MFGEVAEVIGVDLALVDDLTKTNVGKLASAFVALGVPLGMPTEAWTRERERIEGFADGRSVSPPSVARLKTLVGSYRKAKQAGALAPIRRTSSTPRPNADGTEDLAAWGDIFVEHAAIATKETTR